MVRTSGTGRGNAGGGARTGPGTGLGSDDLPGSVKADAARELTAAVAGSPRSTIAVRLPLDDIAEAHQVMEQGADGRVLVQVSSED